MVTSCTVLRGVAYSELKTAGCGGKGLLGEIGRLAPGRVGESLNVLSPLAVVLSVGKAEEEGHFLSRFQEGINRSEKENALFLPAAALGVDPAGKRWEFMLTAAKGLLASSGPVPFWYSKSMGVSW